MCNYLGNIPGRIKLLDSFNKVLLGLIYWNKVINNELIYLFRIYQLSFNTVSIIESLSNYK